MSKHRYLPFNVLFDDDENEVVDEVTANGFRRRIPSPKPKPVLNSNRIHKPELEQQIQDLQEKLDIEERTLQSASRSISLLKEAEDTGICAAKELDHQGEQLKNTNKNLDEIGANLKKSKKHINGIKSVYYEIKNYISSNSPPPLRRKASSKSNPKSSDINKVHDSTVNLSQKTMTKNSFDSHPATHLYNVDAQGTAGSNSQQSDDILEANCVEMTQHLIRLKRIGMELGNQIDQQNELIDTIQNKVEVADIKIEKQKQEMNKIVGK